LLASLEQRVAWLSDAGTASLAELSDEKQQAIVDSLRSAVDRELRSGLLTEIEHKYGEHIVSAHRIDELRKRCLTTTSRLQKEIMDLGRRGNLNLIIGSLTTVTGLALLGYLVFSSSVATPDIQSLLAHYIPRLTLDIFVEVFAYFFLRLYRNSLDEIKYFQNELTNAELKFSALETALLNRDPESLRQVISALATTERNFVLDKGQTTVELEKNRITQTTLSDALVAISRGFTGSNSQSKGG
jgi:hypothetical protein